MTYTIIIILIAFLVVCGIAASAVQQHNEKKEADKRDEITRQRIIYDETEESIVAALQMPVSQTLIALMRNRSLNCLKAIAEQKSSPDLICKIEEISKLISEIDTNALPPNQNTFKLPKVDKVIIKYIQAVKKQRMILRSEHAKGNISPQSFAEEEKALACLQLRVNVETLNKRAIDAVTNNMQGSARQYIEKAINAVKNHKPPNDYSIERKVELEEMLKNLEMNVKDNNLQQLLDEKEKENKEIESLFAPKKKW